MEYLREGRRHPLMKRFITLVTIALIVAAVVRQRQRVRELGRQVLSGTTTGNQWQRVQGLTRQVLRRGTEQISVSAEENKALARRSWEAAVNLDILDEVYAPDVVWHEPDRDLQGLEQAKQYVTMYKTAFPDLQATVEDVIAEGDKVVTRYTVRGTHEGEIEEFGPPTGRQIAIEGITIHRIEGGKIVEEWEAYDNLSVLQQLGLAPEQ
jgi:steroid delta-isomerase-like uncharacterized protein